MKPLPALAFLFGAFASLPFSEAAPPVETREAVARRVDAEYASLFEIYKQLHANPELAFMEKETALLVADQLRALGFEVTDRVGRTGVVAVLRNGPGPTVLARADMDGLPVKENSGVPYASVKTTRDITGTDHPAMHACGHDTHITGLIGTARVLATLKDKWSGTLVMVAQPAEEIVAGAKAMLREGLYTRFPKPDYALALHVTGMLPAGTIGYTEGPFLASVNSLDIIVRGVGGHGASPHKTKDPIVLASQIVLALQTIVSREIKPGTTAVVTVGTIQGGLKRNVISEEVKLELTLRAFDQKVMNQLIESIRRICVGLAVAAGMPEDRLPLITKTPESVGPTNNDPELSRRISGAFRGWLGAERVKLQEPLTGAEDFSEYGQTEHKVPICMWWVGGSKPELHARGIAPTSHSPQFAPEPEPTLKACVISMSAAVFELLGK